MAIARPHPQARRMVPEVVQTSMMDCGPASLLGLMQGFDISVSYGRLREACQTSVDGTSISTMDEVANRLGLHTEEIMLPVDHVLEPASRSLPAIAVVRTPIGSTHFVVIWSVIGPWVQIMDPAQGRRWITRRQLLDQLYVHTHDVPAAQWRVWARSKEFQDALDARLDRLQVSEEARERLRTRALAEPGWRALAALDAAIRMVASLVRSGALIRGKEAQEMVNQLADSAAGCDDRVIIPAPYWSVQPAAEAKILAMRGAVLVRARGRHEAGAQLDELPPELAAALTENTLQPSRRLWSLLVQDGMATPSSVVVAVVAASALVLFQAVMLRGFLELGEQLAAMPQRVAAMLALVLLLALGLALEWPLMNSVLGMGRVLEQRLRMAFLAKLPRLGDRYFHSRLLSDMAERGHSLHLIHDLPLMAARLLRSSAQLLLTVAGIAWLAPEIAPLAVVVALVSIALPLLLQPFLAERDLRVRNHTGALGRFYLDALLGLIPIRVHGAQSAMQREQEGLLVQWSRAGLLLQSAATWIEGVLALSGFGLAVLMMFHVVQRELGATLLLAYWALSLPDLGRQIAIVARQYPLMRNVVLRMLEPLGAPEESDTAAPEHILASPQPAAIRMHQVTVEAGGHTLLEGVNLTIQGGSHVAIVGPSGAGKSSLVGLLLGWHRAAAGRVEIDDRELKGSWLWHMRQQTSWLDPNVQIWNQSFLDNLLYGADGDSDPPIADALDKAALREVLERLPQGLQTPLGEGGKLVSGGEGQRVRLGRALMRKRARLVLLDEPFRGLERAVRRELLAAVRKWWRGATLLWVSHDIAATRDFPRVIVIDQGRVVEDGAPEELIARPGSRYASLLQSYQRVQREQWSRAEWRRLWLRRGQLSEEEPG